MSQSYLYIATIVNGVAVTLPIIFVPDFFERLAIALAALYFLIIAAILNILLDLYFITQLHLGVQSAGIATIIAPGYLGPSLSSLYS